MQMYCLQGTMIILTCKRDCPPLPSQPFGSTCQMIWKRIYIFILKSHCECAYMKLDGGFWLFSLESYGSHLDCQEDFCKRNAVNQDCYLHWYWDSGKHLLFFSWVKDKDSQPCQKQKQAWEIVNYFRHPLLFEEWQNLIEQLLKRQSPSPCLKQGKK